MLSRLGSRDKPLVVGGGGNVRCARLGEDHPDWHSGSPQSPWRRCEQLSAFAQPTNCQ